jgi:hypothetical protein
VQRLRLLAATAGVLASLACAAARVTLKRPRKGYYLGRFSFGGTRFLRASTDPAPMLLSATKRSFGYARRFARCP